MFFAIGSLLRDCADHLTGVAYWRDQARRCDYLYSKARRRQEWEGKRRKASEERAAIDGDTGLLRRDAVTELLVKAVARAFREPSANLGVLFLDLDRFKAVNDRLGHQEGDKILRRVADVLKANLREEDFKIRQGGDEFLVVLANPTDMQATVATAERVREAIKKNMSDYGVTASIGVVHFDPKVWVQDLPQPGDTGARASVIDLLVGAADMLLREAKSLGEDRVCATPFSVAKHAQTFLTRSAHRPGIADGLVPFSAP